MFKQFTTLVLAASLAASAAKAGAVSITTYDSFSDKTIHALALDSVNGKGTLLVMPHLETKVGFIKSGGPAILYTPGSSSVCFHNTTKNEQKYVHLPYQTKLEDKDGNVLKRSKESLFSSRYLGKHNSKTALMTSNLFHNRGALSSWSKKTIKDFIGYVESGHVLKIKTTDNCNTTVINTFKAEGEAEVLKDFLKLGKRKFLKQTKKYNEVSYDSENPQDDDF
jgi:hypothetical protein